MKLSRRKKQWLIISAIALVVAAYFEFIATGGQVCAHGIDSKDDECTQHCFAIFAPLLVLRLLDSYNGLLQGLAGIAVVWFTYWLASIGKTQAEISSKQVSLMSSQAEIMDLTLKETKRSNEEQGELTRAQIAANRIATGNQYEAAQTAIAALKQQVDWARDTFLYANRPKMRVKHVWLIGEIQDGQPIKIQVVIVNSGTTVGVIRECCVGFAILSRDISVDRMLPPKPEYPVRLVGIMRMISSGITWEFPELESPFKLSASQYLGISNTTKSLYCFGHIQYEDTFHNIRNTAFCRKFSRDWMTPPSQVVGAFVKFEDPDYEYED